MTRTVLRLTALLAALLVVSATAVSATSVRQAPLRGDQKPRLAVVSAFAPELERLREEARIHRTVVLNGRTVYVGRLRGNDVVLLLSGISMVNAAMMTEAVLEHFNITGIVVSGIAGGVNPGLSIGDVTVPARWAEYQEHLFAREVDGGYQVTTGFHTAEFGNYGMMFPQYVGVTSDAGPADAEQYKFWFDVDSEMLEIAREVGAGIDLERCHDDGCLDQEPEVVVGGNGVSGPTFVDNAQYREWVWDTFEVDALDMETAAIAHVAYANAVPMIAFRSLSDLAGGGDGENELGVFFQLAADNSAAVVAAFLEAWAQAD